MSVTIRQIAKEAKVSPTTVSNFLNNRSEQMSEETAKRIAAVIERLGYTPNLAARHMVRQRTGTIGVVAPLTWMRNMDFVTGKILSGISEVCFAHDFNISFVEDSNEQKVAKLLNKKRVDGVILFYSTVGDKLIDRVYEAELPFALVNRKIDAPRVNYVHADNYKGTYLATNHLIEQGYRTLAYVTGHRTGDRAPGYETVPVDLERREGFKAALEEHGYPYDPSLVLDNRTLASGFERIIQKPGPYGFVCFNDYWALMVRDLVEQRNLNVPQDVGIVGFDNTLIAGISRPKLTSVLCPYYEMAETATRMLIELINGKKPKQTKILFDTELIVRQSSLRESKLK